MQKNTIIHAILRKGRAFTHSIPAIYSADFKGLVGDSNTRKVACMTFSFIFLLPFHISNAHW